MPLTAAEWLSENSERQELAVMNIPLAMELYARYKADIEAVAFAEWAMNNNYMPDVIEKKHWLSDFDAPNGVEPYTTEQLYSIFKKESNG